MSDGVLVYLRETEVTGALARIAARFPDSRLAFDTYPLATFKFEHKMAAKRGVALWQWPCDDPSTLERLGLRLLESARVTRPPAGLRASLPARYRYLLPFADPVVGRGVTLSLFRAAPVRSSLRPWTVRDVASGNSFHRRSGEAAPYPTASARMCSKISEVSV